jgi:hypothetical protein
MDERHGGEWIWCDERTMVGLRKGPARRGQLSDGDKPLPGEECCANWVRNLMGVVDGG